MVVILQCTCIATDQYECADFKTIKYGLTPTIKNWLPDKNSMLKTIQPFEKLSWILHYRAISWSHYFYCQKISSFYLLNHFDLHALLYNGDKLLFRARPNCFRQLCKSCIYISQITDWRKLLQIWWFTANLLNLFSSTFTLISFRLHKCLLKTNILHFPAIAITLQSISVQQLLSINVVVYLIRLIDASWDSNCPM